MDRHICPSGAPTGVYTIPMKTGETGLAFFALRPSKHVRSDHAQERPGSRENQQSWLRGTYPSNLDKAVLGDSTRALRRFRDGADMAFERPYSQTVEPTV
jgi:hypothetical protein